MMSMSVCASVCQSASISQGPHVQSSHNFLCLLPMAVARSFYDDVAMRYVRVLSAVLWMTACLHVNATWPVISDAKNGVYSWRLSRWQQKFSTVACTQSDSPGGSSRPEAGSVYDRLVILYLCSCFGSVQLK